MRVVEHPVPVELGERVVAVAVALHTCAAIRGQAAAAGRRARPGDIRPAFDGHVRASAFEGHASKVDRGPSSKNDLLRGVGVLAGLSGVGHRVAPAAARMAAARCASCLATAVQARSQRTRSGLGTLSARARSAPPASHPPAVRERPLRPGSLHRRQRALRIAVRSRLDRLSPSLGRGVQVVGSRGRWWVMRARRRCWAVIGSLLRSRGPGIPDRTARPRAPRRSRRAGRCRRRGSGSSTRCPPSTWTHPASGRVVAMVRPQCLHVEVHAPHTMRVAPLCPCSASTAATLSNMTVVGRTPRSAAGPPRSRQRTTVVSSGNTTPSATGPVPEIPVTSSSRCRMNVFTSQLSSFWFWVISASLSSWSGRGRRRSWRRAAGQEQRGCQDTGPQDDLRNDPQQRDRGAAVQRCAASHRCTGSAG